MQPILVTGSAGHLGEALVRRLRAAGQPVRGLDIKPSPFTDACGSITDRAFVAESLRDVSGVIHAATLHKPHVATHSQQAFIDVNISGTLNLLEEAVAAGVQSFVYTSTTSTFGAALTPALDAPAAWIDEDVVPVPRNIYGVSKFAAENLCELFARRRGLAVIVLRTARFFPEDDDDATVRSRYTTANVQANELLYRRLDIADAVDAHLLALQRAGAIGFGRYILSATTPFTPADLKELRHAAPSVVQRLFPQCAALFDARGWRVFEGLDRVYDNRRAREALGWQPRHDFAQMLRALEQGKDFRSELALQVGSKGYHDTVFAHGPYPID
jgi:UDP-glucose 4-epimerase